MTSMMINQERFRFFSFVLPLSLFHFVMIIVFANLNLMKYSRLLLIDK